MKKFKHLFKEFMIPIINPINNIQYLIININFHNKIACLVQDSIIKIINICLINNISLNIIFLNNNSMLIMKINLNQTKIIQSIKMIKIIIQICHLNNN